MFTTFKLLAVWIPFGAFAGILGVPYSLLIRDINQLYRVAMWIVRTGLSAARIRSHVTGVELIPAGVACIFMSNHVSNLDPPVLIAAVPGRCSALLKAEIRKVPILGKAMELAQFVFVERGASSATAQRNVAAARDVLANGLHMIVYPEGTRSRDGRLSVFKKGPFFLALQTGAPIIPVAISGTETMMRKGSSAITPGLAELRFLAPINPADYANRETLQQAVYSAIAAALPDEMKPVPAATSQLR